METKIAQQMSHIDGLESRKRQRINLMISTKLVKLSRWPAINFWRKSEAAPTNLIERRGGNWVESPFVEQPQQMIEAKNGLSVTVRRVRRDDAPDLVYLVETMSERSRYRRYHRPVSEEPPRWIWDEARELAQANRRQKGGLLALANLPTEGETPVGTAYYVRSAEGVAELAISIRDDFQGQGIGFKLLALMAREAWSAGFHTLTAYTQAENQAINILLSKLPYAQERMRVGAEIETEIYLDQPTDGKTRKR